MTIQSVIAVGHPGHGLTGSIGHYWVELVHAFPILFLVAFGVALWRALFPRPQR
jgi:hypothetical protein